MALYERTSQATPDGALVSFSVLYDATALAAPTVQEVGVAPFAGKIVYASTLVNTAVNADTAVTIEIDGGSALDTLQTGTTKGTVDSYSPAPPDAIAAGGVITATSDGTAASGDVIVTVIMQKGS
jgi:hypothetical protein